MLLTQLISRPIDHGSPRRTDSLVLQLLKLSDRNFRYDLGCSLRAYPSASGMKAGVSWISNISIPRQALKPPWSNGSQTQTVSRV